MESYYLTRVAPVVRRVFLDFGQVQLFMGSNLAFVLNST
jgi:hypothetical protein